MPQYRATRHAIARLHERFPALADIAGDGLAAAQWLAAAAARARVAAQQAGADLLLRLELPGEPIYLPVTPQAHDTWIIRTVLTASQAGRNLAHLEAARRQSWRNRQGHGQAEFA